MDGADAFPELKKYFAKYSQRATSLQVPIGSVSRTAWYPIQHGLLLHVPPVVEHATAHDAACSLQHAANTALNGATQPCMCVQDLFRLHDSDSAHTLNRSKLARAFESAGIRDADGATRAHTHACGHTRTHAQSRALHPRTRTRTRSCARARTHTGACAHARACAGTRTHGRAVGRSARHCTWRCA